MFLSQKERYEKEWELLLREGIKRNYMPGDVIYIQGEENRIGLVCIVQGKVKNCTYFKDGSEKLVCILEAPAITGETAVIDGGGNIVSAQALTAVKTAVISMDKIKTMMEDNPRFLLFLLEQNAAKMRALQFQAENSCMSTREKLARMLANFQRSGIATYSHDKNKLSLTHEQISDYLGTTRSKITEALNDFEKLGYIKKHRGCIEILDYEGLLEISEK